MPEYAGDIKKRAKINEIMDWCNSNFYRDWGYNLAYPQLFPHHKRQTDEAQQKTLEWGLERSKFWLTVLNDYFLANGKNWLTGDDITVADYFCGSVVALGEMIGTDFSKYPRVQAWLKNVKGLKHWGAISAELDGFAASVKDQTFVRA